MYCVYAPASLSPSQSPSRSPSASPTSDPSADPCGATRCVIDCATEPGCGWDEDQGRCRTGAFIANQHCARAAALWPGASLGRREQCLVRLTRGTPRCLGARTSSFEITARLGDCPPVSAPSTRQRTTTPASGASADPAADPETTPVVGGGDGDSNDAVVIGVCVVVAGFLICVGLLGFGYLRRPAPAAPTPASIQSSTLQPGRNLMLGSVLQNPAYEVTAGVSDETPRLTLDAGPTGAATYQDVEPNAVVQNDPLV